MYVDLVFLVMGNWVCFRHESYHRYTYDNSHAITGVGVCLLVGRRGTGVR